MLCVIKEKTIYCVHYIHSLITPKRHCVVLCLQPILDICMVLEQTTQARKVVVVQDGGPKAIVTYICMDWSPKSVYTDAMAQTCHRLSMQDPGHQDTMHKDHWLIALQWYWLCSCRCHVSRVHILINLHTAETLLTE